MSQAKARRPARPNTRLLLRDIHLYLGVLFAPTILFFALTGALQLYHLHEASRDGGYTPPAVVVKLSQVHIHQRFAEPPRRPEPAASKAPKPAPKPAAAAPARKPQPVLAQAFFLATAIGLALAALLGLWIGITQGRRRSVAVVLAIAGLLIPVGLLALT